METKAKWLLGIVACHYRAQHLDVIRRYWVPDIKGRFDYKFFFGAGTHTPTRDDEVILGGDDAYRGLADKIRRSVQWALAHGYEGFFKIDDDGAWIASRLYRAVEFDWAGKDYVGRVNGATDFYHTSHYARGGTGYYISKAAMEYLASRPTPNPDNPKEYAEDSWVGWNMKEGGFVPFNDNRLRCADFSGPNRGPRPQGSTTWKRDVPTVGNDYITTCEFLGEAEMGPVYEEWIKSRTAHTTLMNKLRIK